MSHSNLPAFQEGVVGDNNNNHNNFSRYGAPSTSSVSSSGGPPPTSFQDIPIIPSLLPTQAFHPTTANMNVISSFGKNSADIPIVDSLPVSRAPSAPSVPSCSLPYANGNGNGVPQNNYGNGNGYSSANNNNNNNYNNNNNSGFQSTSSFNNVNGSSLPLSTSWEEHVQISMTQNGGIVMPPPMDFAGFMPAAPIDEGRPSGGWLRVSVDRFRNIDFSTAGRTSRDTFRKSVDRIAGLVSDLSMNGAMDNMAQAGHKATLQSILPQSAAARRSIEKDRRKSIDDARKSHESEPKLPTSNGLSTKEAEELLKVHGRNELIEKVTPGWIIFVRCLWGPMPIALWIAMIVEFCLKNYPDGAILAFIQFANATIGWYETTKAQDAVAALKKALKPVATVKRDGQWQDMDAAILVPGDLVKLASGSSVPADCTVNDGSIDVDEAALTGESLPVAMSAGGMPKMGSTVVRGEVEATVQFTGSKTFFGKTALLLQSVEVDLGNIHRVLTLVMFVLTGLALVLCATAFGYLMGHLKTDFADALEFTVVLLVVSIPIAIEIVVTTTLALGSKELSLKKVIVTRLSAIEMMSGVNILCSDKTGTLTLNKMEIQEDCPVFNDHDNRASVLVLAALATKWREPPRDALDTMVLGSANLDDCDKYTQLDYVPFDPKHKRTEATLKDAAGKQFIVTKGAPNIILKLCVNADEIKDRVESIIHDLGARGIRCLSVARTDDEGNFRMAGILTFLDPPRPDTKDTIHRSKHFGVDVKMITGDHQLIAKEMARMLDMGNHIMTPEGLPSFPASGDPKDIPKDLGKTHGDLILSCDGFAQVFPEHKYLIVEALRQRGFTTAMTGDGVNDAPALKRADVGIAVHGATDAARAAASMVLTEPGLSVVVDAMIIARGVFQRMLSFITYRIAATLQLLFFFFIALLAIEPVNYGFGVTEDPNDPAQLWRGERFFHIPVLLLMLITLLNDGTLMSIGYDRVFPSPRPQRWNLPVIFLVSSVLAIVACGSSLLLLWMAVDSHNPTGVFQTLYLPALDYGSIVMTMYLKISVSDFLTLFSARAQEKWFFQIPPSMILLIGAAISLSISTIVACVFDQTLNFIPTSGLAKGDTIRHNLMPLWIWLYCIFWWWVQDVLKVLTFYIIKKYNIFDFLNIKGVAALAHEQSTKAAVIRPVEPLPQGAALHH